MGALENRGREEWGVGGGEGTGGIRERKEWVMGVLKKWEFFPMLPCSRFFSPTFLVHQSIFSLIEPFTTINSASHLFNFQYSDQTIFLRQTSRVDHYTKPKLHNSQPDQPQIRPPNPSTTPDHPQTRTIRPSDQTVTTIPDHQIRSSQQTTILDYSVSDQHSTTSLLEWYRLGAFLMGWVKGGFIELWMNLAKHTFHTRSA